jgi:sRNA-binding protein
LSPLPAPAAEAAAELSPAATGARLAELFPALFGTPPKPIKLRIQADIQERAPGLFTKKSLSLFLHRHTTSTAYLRALAAGPTRFDLDGQGAGEIAAEHREAAQAEVERRRAIVEAKRAAEREALRERARAEHRAATEQARAQRDAEFDARRERAALLRAFETSTLTRANFCALKRITEADLEAQLVLARKEREERPPMPPRIAPPSADFRPRPAPRSEQRDDRRGPRPPGKGRPPRENAPR